MSGHVIIEDSGTGLANQEDRDWLDAANIMAAAHAVNSTDVVVSGLGLTPDYGVPEVAVASGMVRMTAQNVDSRDHGDGVTTWPEVTITAVVDADTLALTDGDTNEIYVDIGLTSGPDDIQLVAVNSAGSAPAAPALKIGEVNTTDDTTLVVNDKPDGSFSSLEADTADVSSLSAGGWSFIGEYQTLADFEETATSGDRGYITDEQQFAYEP